MVEPGLVVRHREGPARFGTCANPPIDTPPSTGHAEMRHGRSSEPPATLERRLDMTGLKAIFALCLFGALVSGAALATSATAATKGTTAYTCRAEAGGTGFSKGHCAPADAVASGASYKHVAVAENSSTKGRASNEDTNAGTSEATSWTLKVTLAGTPLELSATAVTGEGLMENKKAASGEHYVTGTGQLTFSGVTVAKPAGKECKVFEDAAEGKEGTEGIVKTKELKATTEGQGDFLKVEPKEGSTFATFVITCNPEVPETLQGTISVTGSMKCPTDGATLTCSHTEVTTQTTLKAKGAKAGIEGKLTVSSEEEGPCGLIYTPLSVTTTETP